MIVQLGKVTIDTSQAWAEHRKTINRKTHCFCEDDSPVQWFTQRQASEGTRNRFYHLYYNKKGTELQKITSWDDPQPVYKEVKKLRGEKEVCYFTKQDEKLEYCMVKERDYSIISENPVTHWEKGWAEPAYQALPIQKKKRFGFF